MARPDGGIILTFLVPNPRKMSLYCALQNTNQNNNNKTAIATVATLSLEGSRNKSPTFLTSDIRIFGDTTRLADSPYWLFLSSLPGHQNG